MKVLTYIRVIIALCILTSCSSETEKNSVKSKEKVTSIVQASSDTVSNPIDSSNTSKVTMPSEIAQDELDRHNRWLALHNDWDTVMKAEWIDSKRVVSSFKHKILSYKDSLLHGNGKLIKGMLEDKIDSTWMKNSNYLYSSQLSKTGKYLAFIMDWGHEGTMGLLDIENNLVYEIGGRGPYLWVSWSPDDSYCVSMAEYEEHTQFFCFNNTEKSGNEFDIYQSISDDKYIVFDERTLRWISNYEFMIDVYLFCYTYGIENASEDCDQWNYEDWYGLKELGEKHTYRFSCESESVKVLN